MKENKTTQYLIPTIDDTTSSGVKEFNISLLKKYGLVGVYLDFKDYDKSILNFNTNQSLWFLFITDREKIKNWSEFREIYKKQKSYQGEIDYDLNVVILLFKMKDKYKDFKTYLINGQYSKLDVEKYANLFIDNVKGNLLPLNQFFVIKKDKEIVKMVAKKFGVEEKYIIELDEMPKEEEEILSKQIVNQWLTELNKKNLAI